MPFRQNKSALLSKVRGIDRPSSTPPRPEENEDTTPRSPFRHSSHALSRDRLDNPPLSPHLPKTQSPDAGDLRKGRPSRAKSLPAVEHLVDGKAHAISAVNKAESRIDIEQAIMLLQELKKDASPEELIALHRALLPVKETTTPSPRLSTADEHAYTSIPPARKRSVMPPGLATRSGLSEDLLRRQQDWPHTPVRERMNNRILDPPGDYSQNSSPTRLGTPSGQHWHAGAFQSGTLRVTNGAVSPEPSIISRRAVDMEPEDNKERDGAVRSRTSLDVQIGRMRQDISNAHHTPLRSDTAPESAARRLSSPRPESLDDHSRGRSRVKANPPPSAHQHHSPPLVSTPAGEPRFRHIWGHRAADLSLEYLNDCDIGSSPYDENDGRLAFGKPLDMVNDEERNGSGPERDELRARADTLSKLTATDEASGNALRFLTNAAMIESEATPVEMSARHTIVKKDSGYCSDLPPSPLQHKGRSGVTGPVGLPDTPKQQTPKKKDFTDVSSFSFKAIPYRAEEIVNTPSPSDTGMASSPSSVVKKPLPLSIFKTKPRKTDGISGLPSKHHPAPDENITESPSGSAPHTSAGDRLQRKLQKPMPESVRRQRRKTFENLRASQPERADFPLGTEDVDRHGLSASQAQGTEFRLVPQNHTPESLNDIHSITPAAADLLEEARTSLRKRSRSFVRGRGKSIAEPTPATPNGPRRPPDENSIHSIVPERKRSKSVAAAGNTRHGDGISKKVDTDATAAGQHHQHHLERLATSSEQENIVQRKGSIHTNFASVAKALEPLSTSSSYHAPGLSEDHHKPRNTHIQSSGGGGSNDEQPPPPPTHHNKTSDGTLDANSSTGELPPSGFDNPPPAVEARFPGWRSRPSPPDNASRATTSSPQQRPSSPRHRSNRSRGPMGSETTSSSSAVPPLPQLPPDFESKVLRANEMVAKKFMLGAWAGRNGKLVDAKVDVGTEGDAKRQQTHEGRQAALDGVSHQPTALQMRGSGSGGGGAAVAATNDDVLESNPQSQKWRGDETIPLVARSSANLHRPLPTPPEIKFSRYISPQGAHDMHSHQQQHRLSTSTSTSRIGAEKKKSGGGDGSLRFAKSYSDLIATRRDQHLHASTARPGLPRMDSVVAAATLVTISSDHRPAKVDISRSGSANSNVSAITSSTTTSLARSSWSDGGSRSSHSSLSPTTTATTNATMPRSQPPHSALLFPSAAAGVNFQPHAPGQAHARPNSKPKKGGGGSRTLDLARRFEPQHSTSTSTSNNPSSNPSLALPPLTRPAPLQHRSSETLFDRFSGGLHYGWDRQTGRFGGSAGTVSTSLSSSSPSDPATVGGADRQRKSVKFSEELGLDLSDIPVFLQRSSLERQGRGGRGRG